MLSQKKFYFAVFDILAWYLVKKNLFFPIFLIYDLFTISGKLLMKLKKPEDTPYLVKSVPIETP